MFVFTLELVTENPGFPTHPTRERVPQSLGSEKGSPQKPVEREK